MNTRRSWTTASSEPPGQWRGPAERIQDRGERWPGKAGARTRSDGVPGLFDQLQIARRRGGVDGEAQYVTGKSEPGGSLGARGNARLAVWDTMGHQRTPPPRVPYPRGRHTTAVPAPHGAEPRACEPPPPSPISGRHARRSSRASSYSRVRRVSVPSVIASGLRSQMRTCTTSGDICSTVHSIARYVGRQVLRLVVVHPSRQPVTVLEHAQVRVMRTHENRPSTTSSSLQTPLARFGPPPHPDHLRRYISLC